LKTSISNRKKTGSLEITRNVGESVDIGIFTVKVINYSTERGNFYLSISEENKDNRDYYVYIGETVQVADDIELSLLGYSIKTGRLEFRISAPLSVKINRH
jgi:sRNA-binding carbon storage regulator CsrA